MPLQSLDIHLTNKCNFNCRHCLYCSGKDDSEEGLSFFDYKKILKDFSVICDKKGYINLFGGEPLMNENFWNIVKFAKKLSLKTNLISGFRLSEDTIDKILKSNFDRITFGIHGNEKNHDWLKRSKGDYSHIIKIIKSFQKIQRKPHINITTVLHKNNLKDVKTLLKLAKDLKVDSYTFLFFTPIGRGARYKKLMIDSVTWQRNKKIILDWITINKPKFSITIECPYRKADNKQQEKGFCSGQPLYSLEIRNNGNVYFCGLLSSVNGPTLGNLKNQSLFNIYGSIKNQLLNNINSCPALALKQKNKKDPRRTPKGWLPSCPYEVETLN
ncbi:MAG: hypothetical protein PWQ56_47 [Patescibacteria group bacterium]|nr:hypothetical protein [Patescibacteria group bacterium]